TEANLRWTVATKWAAEGVTFRLHNADAVHMSENMDGALVDAIVTEPYMGKTSVGARESRVTSDEIKNTIKGLEKLYIGCLRDWNRILKPQGVVVMALPMYVVGEKSYFVKKVIDMCETLGYTIIAGPIEYSRPQAVVKR